MLTFNTTLETTLASYAKNLERPPASLGVLAIAAIAITATGAYIYSKLKGPSVELDANSVNTNQEKEVTKTSNTSPSQIPMIKNVKEKQYILSPVAAKFAKNKIQTNTKNLDMPSDIGAKIFNASVKEMLVLMIEDVKAKQELVESAGRENKPLLMIEDVKAKQELAGEVNTSNDATLENANTSNSSPSIGIKVALAATAVTAGLVGLATYFAITPAVIGHALAQAGAALTTSILPAVAAFMLTPTGIGLGIGLLLAATALVGYLSNSKTPTEVIEVVSPITTTTKAATKIQSAFRGHSFRNERAIAKEAQSDSRSRSNSDNSTIDPSTKGSSN